MKTLHSLKKGEAGRVCEICATGDIRRRLMDLGIVKGTKITCELYSPGGTLHAYRVRGALIALRNKERTAIRIKNSV